MTRSREKSAEITSQTDGYRVTKKTEYIYIYIFFLRSDKCLLYCFIWVVELVGPVLTSLINLLVSFQVTGLLMFYKVCNIMCVCVCVFCPAGSYVLV